MEQNRGIKALLNILSFLTGKKHCAKAKCIDLHVYGCRGEDEIFERVQMVYQHTVIMQTEGKPE